MASEQGHWITKNGKKVFIKEDLIDKQYKEIERSQQIRDDLNAVRQPNQADFTIEPDSYGYGNREEESKKEINAVKNTITAILKSAKSQGVQGDKLVDFVYNALADAYPQVSPYDNADIVVANNQGIYDPNALLHFVRVDISETRFGNLAIKLVGSSAYISEFDDEDLEQMGIYKT